MKMTGNRWEAIKRQLHFNDNPNVVRVSYSSFDKLFKVRLLPEVFRERLLLVPNEEFLAVDEQIIHRKCRQHLKKYSLSKIHKWGYKIYFCRRTKQSLSRGSTWLWLVQQCTTSNLPYKDLGTVRLTRVPNSAHETRAQEKKLWFYGSESCHNRGGQNGRHNLVW